MSAFGQGIKVNLWRVPAEVGQVLLATARANSVPRGGESSQGAAEAISDSNAMNALVLIPFGF